MFTLLLSDEVMSLSCLPVDEPNILCPTDKFSYVKKASGHIRLGEPQTYYGLVYDPFLTLERYLELSAGFIPKDFPGIIKGILNGICTVYSHFEFADVCDSSIVVHNATGKLLCPRSTPSSINTLAGELKCFGDSLHQLSPKERPEELKKFIHALDHVDSALQHEMLPFHPYLFSPDEKVNKFIQWLHRFAKDDLTFRRKLKMITEEFPPWRQRVRELDDSYQEFKACLDFKFTEEKKEIAVDEPEDESKFSFLTFLRNCVQHLDDYVIGRSRFLEQPELFLDFIDMIAKDFLVRVFHEIYDQESIF